MRAPMSMTWAVTSSVVECSWRTFVPSARRRVSASSQAAAGIRNVTSASTPSPSAPSERSEPLA